MSTVALVDPEVRLVVRAGALVIEKRGEAIRTLQTHQVDELQLHGTAELTAAARNLLLREGIGVAFFTLDGRYVGRLVASEGRSGELRLAQYALVADATRRLAVARAIVRGKIENQRALLLQRNRHLRDEGLADALSGLRALAARADEAADLEQLRGLEGAAARAHFAGLARALRNTDLPFSGRTRRPPRDPVNAALSFGYAVLLSKVEAAIRATSLDLHLGFLHDAIRGAPSLALDLMEELRPAVDAVVLTLVNRRQLTPEDFRTPTAEELGAEAEVEEGAVWLGKVARAVLLRALEARFSEPAPHPLRDDRWPLRGLLAEQAAQIARLARGEQDRYAPIALGGT